MLSIVIPARNEVFLQKTILDVLNKATGEIEIFPVLDGYEPPAGEIVDDLRVKYIRLPKDRGHHKRQGINLVVNLARGEYVMSLDAHCMMAPGFDEVLAADCGDDWVVVPRRHRLNAENWSIQIQSDDRPPIDYEYIMYPGKYNPGFHGWKWAERTLERMDKPEYLIDDDMTMQASCWMMRKSYFKKMGFMQVEGYSGWGQEAEEICFKVWLSGGRVVVNKKTWYAHLHKGRTYGRMYFMDKKSVRKCNAFAFDYWMNDRWPERKYDFDWLIKKFSPPGWPDNWREELRGRIYDFGYELKVKIE